MALSRPDLMAGLAAAVLCAVMLLSPVGSRAQVALDPTLPISLDADTSDFDRRRNIVVFTGLRISQGPLQIRSERAQASQIDFENAVWDFFDNVQIDLDQSSLVADEARLAFIGYRLDTAVATGNPAVFEDPGTASGKLVRGRAGRIEYDVSNGIIRLTEGAWLAEGANEITGATLVYNLQEERVLAEGDGERVRITIQPPASRETPTP
ncbi:MAG: lipopolysaccharide transport periplasmic protein LptA [Gammaproteobacteria bacterium]|nr:MAG: lipopolysaccharide transport periplasmic protein LptA [Gammaproteobacteria bacterium]